MTRRPLPLAEAEAIARAFAAELEPHAQRVQIVGSVRRRKAEVSDIELLIEPKTAVIELGLFDSTSGPDLEPIRSVARNWGTLASNGDRYIKVLTPDGLQVDLFLCHPPAEWGSLLAIRTGPAALGKHAVTMLARRGYPHREGGIRHRGKPVPVPDEETFFRLAGLPCLPPEQRHLPAAFVEADSARNRRW